jgi:hypothetical protein
MKKIAGAGIAFVLFLAAVLSLSAQVSQEDQQKATEAYIKAGAVTENHKLLAYFVGRWDVTTSLWDFPGNPPSTSKNEAEWKSIMGGRFIMAMFSGTMMGQPYEGVQVNGFDNIQNKFQTFWIDSTATAFFLLSGTYDAMTKTWTDRAIWSDPLGGKSPVRIVTRIIGPDEYDYQMFMGLPDGKEFKSMENRYIRKK